jgi:hypothetical protein
MPSREPKRKRHLDTRPVVSHECITMSRRASHLEQLTIRGFGPELAREIRELARREGISLNNAALRLLRRGAGLADATRNDNVIGDGLDDLIGTWSDEEAAQVAAGTAGFRQVDEDLWR